MSARDGRRPSSVEMRTVRQIRKPRFAINPERSPDVAQKTIPLRIASTGETSPPASGRSGIPARPQHVQRRDRERAFAADIMTADSNSSAANTINVTASITLTETTAGELEIQNATSTAKTLTIDGQASSPSATVIAGSSSWNTRIFEIAGAGGAGVTVVFKDLEITGGRAHNGGGPAALGGGILIDGGQVTISNASIIGNHASGQPASTGQRGASGYQAPPVPQAETPEAAESTWQAVS